MHVSADNDRRPWRVKGSGRIPSVLTGLFRPANGQSASLREATTSVDPWRCRSALSLGTVTALVFCTVIPPAHALPGAAPSLDLPLANRTDDAPSHVPLSFGVELAWLRRQVAEHVPVTWNEENRTIAPGTVADVALSRGEIALALERDILTLTMPVDMNLSVRSRLGAWVVPLGRCRATIDVAVTTSLRMNGEGALPLPTGRAQMREPCHLSALDVTPFLQREIDRQLARGQRHLIEWQIRQQVEFQRLRGEVFRRLETHAQSGIRLCPRGVRQPNPTLQDGVLLSRLQIDGQVAKRCGGELTGVTIQTEESARPFDLVRTQRIAWSEFGATLAKHLAMSGKSQSVIARSASRDDRDLVAILIRTTKQSGWVLAQPEITRRGGTLTNLTADNPELLADLKPELDEFSFPVDTADVEMLSNDIVDELTAISRIWGDQADSLPASSITTAELETVSDIRVERDGLVLTTHRQSRAPNSTGAKP